MDLPSSDEQANAAAIDDDGTAPPPGGLLHGLPDAVLHDILRIAINCDLRTFGALCATSTAARDAARAAIGTGVRRVGGPRLSAVLLAAVLPHCEGLQELDCGESGHRLDMAALGTLAAHCPHLVFLSLNHCRTADAMHAPPTPAAAIPVRPHAPHRCYETVAVSAGDWAGSLLGALLGA